MPQRCHTFRNAAVAALRIVVSQGAMLSPAVVPERHVPNCQRQRTWNSGCDMCSYRKCSNASLSRGETPSICDVKSWFTKRALRPFAGLALATGCDTGGCRRGPVHRAGRPSPSKVWNGPQSSAASNMRVVEGKHSGVPDL